MIFIALSYRFNSVFCKCNGNCETRNNWTVGRLQVRISLKYCHAARFTSLSPKGTFITCSKLERNAEF